MKFAKMGQDAQYVWFKVYHFELHVKSMNYLEAFNSK